MYPFIEMIINGTKYMKGEIKNMDISTFEPVTIFIIMGGIIGLLLILGAPIKPMQFLGRALVKIIIGAIALFVINSIGTLIGFHIPINLMTASVSGFLGFPGMITLIAIEQIIL